MEKTIATKIIQRYEKSNKSDKSIKEGNMSVNFAIFKQYNSDSNFKYRIAINKAANKLRNNGLIKVKWISEDNIIDRIFFNLKDIKIFYDLAEMSKKKDILENVIDELKSYDISINNNDIKNILENWKTQVLTKHKVPKIIEESKKRQFILKALKGIDELLSNNNTMYERAFSKRYLGSSKIFEKQIRTIMLSLIRKYFTQIHEDLDDDEILNEVGIEKTT
ncbi:MAG: hypothetical protein VB130_10440, partial [Clostridium sp.]|nr:hypothetical protein [Clostridium sp.]